MVGTYLGVEGPEEILILGTCVVVVLRLLVISRTVLPTWTNPRSPLCQRRSSEDQSVREADNAPFVQIVGFGVCPYLRFPGSTLLVCFTS